MTNHFHWLLGSTLNTSVSQITCHHPERFYHMLALTLSPPSSPYCSRGEASRSWNRNDPDLKLLQLFT